VQRIGIGSVGALLSGRDADVVADVVTFAVTTTVKEVGSACGIDFWMKARRLDARAATT
jgi:hypothetical protein